MSASGETIATAVASTTRARKGLTGSLGADGLLPLLEEIEPLLLVERIEDVRADGDGLQHLPQLLLQRRGGRLALHVVADGEEGRLGDQLLTALREQVVEEDLAHVGVLGRLRQYRYARHHQRVVLRVDDGERRILALPRRRIGAEDVEAEEVLAGGDPLEHGADARVQLHGHGPKGLRGLPEGGIELRILCDEEKTDAAPLGIV